ncbi:unnamed protein product [Bursaphelenchus okinawaensis]|uniref:DNA-directed RNA polymerases I and III subunit RPAC1 n=1 Tax=Bursaphelenchus okinawaensis TaxID=465554 RepID=A0A811L7V7_9BILA|nr:unnamed protein product [Bursaphelenchus okinawaensis]CAG9119752.1 unnamed protein product [Bursaphelenchus okinawaensis]
MVLFELVLLALGLIPLGFLALFVIAQLYPYPRRNAVEYAIRERRKYKPEGEGDKFDSLLHGNAKELKDLQVSEAKCYLSVVVPAMNEEERLPIMLNECLEYLQKREKDDKNFTYEVIVVDDGSSDRTCDVAYGYSEKGFNLSVYKLEKNAGKGGAIRNGVFCARGEYILFADADGATKFSDFLKLEEVLKTEEQDVKTGQNEQNRGQKEIVVVGSRAHLEKDSISERSLLRTILMIGFHCLVYVFAVRSVRDTQCGFKLFSRKAAAFLFPRIHVERWAFDVELLYISEVTKISVHEVSVQWHEVDGSKLAPLWTSIEMGRDILLIWMVRKVKQEMMEVDEERDAYLEDRLYMEPEISFNTFDMRFPKDVDQYLNRIEAKVISEQEEGMELVFDLVHVEAPVANALRRVLLAEVPTMAIEKIYLYQNTSVIPDEVLCHRIGLLPVKADPRKFDFPSKPFVPISDGVEVTEEPEGNENEHIILEVNVKCTTNKDSEKGEKDPEKAFHNYKLYSGQFDWIPIGNQAKTFKKNHLSMVHDDIIVAKLRPGQEVEARCHCVKGIGRDHAKFSPVCTATYRLLPEIILKSEVTGEKAERLQTCFSKGVIELEEKKGKKVAKVVDARRDTCSRNVFRYEDLKDLVELRKKKDHFIFSVESTGALTSRELVKEACKVIREKAHNLHSLFDQKLNALSEKQA